VSPMLEMATAELPVLVTVTLCPALTEWVKISCRSHQVNCDALALGVAQSYLVRLSSQDALKNVLPSIQKY
jgi:hypothetical protein